MEGSFVGRDRELAELLAGLEDALAGHGRLVLLAGEPGIGKTRLSERLTQEAGARGARAVWAPAWEGGDGAPYWAWTQVIRGVIEDLDDEALGPFLTPEAAHLALLAPELRGRFRAQPPQGALDSSSGRFYLFEAVSRFLRRVGASQPLVLVLDDLLAGDRPSLLLLRFLARDLRQSRLLVVVTCREAEAVNDPDVADAWSDLVREGRLLRLTGLGQEDVGKLIAGFTGTRPWKGKVEAIHRATEGNPLFVREVTRLAATTDALDQPGKLAIAVPDSVRAAIRRRIAPLSADAIQALSSAAVVGRQFDVALVGAAADLPVDRTLSSVSEAASLGLVQEVPDVVGLYRFSHQLAREAIYEGLPLPARTQIHRRVAEAIEDRHGTDITARLGELAYHFAQAAAIGEAAKAVSYAREAGERAMDAHAYEEAAIQYRRALAAAPFAEPDEASDCELLLRLGEAQARSGDYAAARKDFLRAAEIARRLEAHEHLARAALGYGEPQVEGGLVDQRLVDLIREALDALSPDDSPLRARLLARLSLEFTFTDDDAFRAQRDSLSREALDMARGLADVPARVSACRARWMAVWGPDGLDERSGLSEEILALARETGDGELELLGRARRITCSLEAGDRTAGDADIAAHGRVAGELRMPYHEWTAATLRAARALLDGSLEEGERLADEALGMLPGTPLAPQAHLNQNTLIRWEQGLLGELRPAWAGLVQTFPRAAFARAWLCLADLELGRENDAREALSSLVEIVAGLSRDGLWLPALTVTSLVVSALDDQAAAKQIHELLLPYTRHVVVIPMPHPVICLGSASLYLGLTAGVLGRWEEAEQHLEAAMHANERLGASAFVARTRYEAARALIRGGRATDRSRAMALLGRAEDSARQLGMIAVARACQHLRDLEAGTAVAGPASTGQGNVFRREGNYWTVEFEESVVRLQDSKGLRHLARLLASPGREIPAVDLEAAEAGAGPAERRAGTVELEVRADLGDAGELLDATAKAQYRARLEELQAELDEAESFNDPARAAKAKAEIDFLASELARAVGLGGRDRRAASHAERARLNATRAIRASIRNLSRAHPSLGRHLEATIHTGRFCSYTPDPRAPVAWEA